MDTVAVEYFDERKGFWRLGYLEKTDRTWAWVRPIVGRKVRLPIAQTRKLEQKEATRKLRVAIPRPQWYE